MTVSEKLLALDAAIKGNECFHRAEVGSWAEAEACVALRDVLPELARLAPTLAPSPPR